MNIQASISLYAIGGPGSGCHGPNCGRPKTRFEEGDKVRLTKATKGWNSPLKRKAFQPGTVTTIVKVLPQLTGHPPMLQVQLGKRGSIEYVKVADVELHRKAGKPFDPDPIKPEDVPRKQVISRSSSAEGVKYTIVRPSPDDHTDKALTNFADRAHTLKGKFDVMDKVQGMSDIKGHEGQNLKTIIYEAKRGDGSGAVVWAHRYSDPETGDPQKTIIREENYKQDHFRYGSPRQFSYNNYAKAVGVMNKRYGVGMKMKDWRF